MMKILRTYRSKITSLEEKKKKHYVSGHGESVVWRTESLGWWVTFEGWPASMLISETKPDLAVGDYVVLTLEKCA